MEGLVFAMEALVKALKFVAALAIISTVSLIVLVLWLLLR